MTDYRPVDPNEIEIKCGDVVSFNLTPHHIDSSRVKNNNVFIAYVTSYNTDESFEITYQENTEDHGLFVDSNILEGDIGLVLKRNNRRITLLVRHIEIDAYIQDMWTL